MAVVFYKYFVNMTWVDGGGNESTTRVEVDGGVGGIELAGNVDIIVNRMNACSDAVLKGFTIESVYREDALVLPANTVHVEDRALLTLRLDSFAKSASFQIPAPNIGIFVGTTGANANIVDGADAAIVDIVNMFVAGSGQARLSDGESTLASPDGFIRGKRIHRASSKG